MPTFHTLLVFAGAALVLAMLPGPELFYIAGRTLAGGKYDATSRLAAGDLRSHSSEWMGWFKDGRVAADLVERITAVRELLTSGGRAMVQGALGWNWGRSRGTIPSRAFAR